MTFLFPHTFREKRNDEREREEEEEGNREKKKKEIEAKKKEKEEKKKEKEEKKKEKEEKKREGGNAKDRNLSFHSQLRKKMRGREKVTILLKETSPVLQRRIQTKNSLLLSLLFLPKREEKERKKERK